MHEFVLEPSPVRVRFGSGAVVQIGAEIERLGSAAALVVTTAGRVELGHHVAELLGTRSAGVHDGAVMHVPSDVVMRAIECAVDVGADALVSVGGGSAAGLAKAIALSTGLPQVAVPTTYAGSEMTPVWGITEGGVKTTGRDPRVLARTVVYDPELTLGLPPQASLTSGINALAHAAEALYAADSHPMTTLAAIEAVRSLGQALPNVVRHPSDLTARSEALYGAWLAGSCLGTSAMGLHHQLCHILGGTLALPHAATHTVVLPHVLAANLPAAPEARDGLSTALDSQDPAATIHGMVSDLGGPTSLRELGMAEESIEDIVGQVLCKPYANPRTVTARLVGSLLEDAWDGRAPSGR